MARFTTRVELHSASGDDYETLHAEMEAEGFSRQIASDDGNVYHMPWAEYNRESTLNRSQILGSAKAAAARVRKQYSVLVTESAGRTWYNLDKVG